MNALESSGLRVLREFCILLLRPQFFLTKNDRRPFSFNVPIDDPALLSLRSHIALQSFVLRFGKSINLLCILYKKLLVLMT